MHLADLQNTRRTVRFDQSRLTIEDIVDIAQGRANAALSDDPAFRAAISRGADFLDQLLREDGTVYGVTTGYGDSCTTTCLLYTSPSPRDLSTSRMPSSA